MKLTQAQIDVAAEWWAEHFKAPTFNHTTKEEDQAPGGLTNVLTKIMANSLAKENPQTDQNVTNFKNRLKNLLQDSQCPLILDVDYHPCPLLSTALRMAEIPNGITTLPWKTIMWIKDDGSIKAKCGYGVQAEYVLKPNSGEKHE